MAAPATERLTTPQLLERLGLKTARPLVKARAVRTSEGRWWQACRGSGLRDDEPPERWIAPYVDGKRDDAAELEREPSRRCGRGRAVDYDD